MKVTSGLIYRAMEADDGKGLRVPRAQCHGIMGSIRLGQKSHLDREEFREQGKKDCFFTVPDLLSTAFNAAPELPPLTSIFHADLAGGRGV